MEYDQLPGIDVGVEWVDNKPIIVRGVRKSLPKVVPSMDDFNKRKIIYVDVNGMSWKELRTLAEKCKMNVEVTEDLKIGDIVKLNTGSPDLTIIRKNKDRYFDLMHYDSDRGFVELIDIHEKAIKKINR